MIHTIHAEICTFTNVYSTPISPCGLKVHYWRWVSHAKMESKQIRTGEQHILSLRIAKADRQRQALACS
jgi:hypothetical protein